MSRHLKRLAAPKTWNILRRGKTFVTKSLPGAHSLERGMPLILILGEMLKLAKTSRESKTILNDGNIMVNNVIRKEPKSNVGLFDVISIKGVGNYIVLFDQRGRLMIRETKKDGKERLVKITGKTTLRNKKTQLNFLDGTNIVTDKDTFKVGDSLILQDKNIVKHLRFENGAKVYLIAGKHVGKVGVIEDTKSFKGIYSDKIIININNEKAETLKKYAVIVDSGFENE